MKINLFQVLPVDFLSDSDKRFGIRHVDSDVMYCDGIDNVSYCLHQLYEKGFKCFNINFLGEVICSTDEILCESVNESVNNDVVDLFNNKK